jgi:uridine phosphorylase
MPVCFFIFTQLLEEAVRINLTCLEYTLSSLLPTQNFPIILRALTVHHTMTFQSYTGSVWRTRVQCSESTCFYGQFSGNNQTVCRPHVNTASLMRNWCSCTIKSDDNTSNMVFQTYNFKLTAYSRAIILSTMLDTFKYHPPHLLMKHINM